MMNAMTYKGYSTGVGYEGGDRIFTGKIAGIRDGNSLDAENVEALQAAFNEAAADYIKTCARLGKGPQKPYSARMMFRVSPEVHRMATQLAGKSLNQWAE